MSIERGIYELLRLPRSALKEHIECKICGGLYQSITAHLRIHDISIAEYKTEFNSPIVSERLRVNLVLKQNASDFKYKTFYQARKTVHSLGLKGQSEWRALIKAGKIPKDILVLHIAPTKSMAGSRGEIG